MWQVLKSIVPGAAICVPLKKCCTCRDMDLTRQKFSAEPISKEQSQMHRCLRMTLELYNVFLFSIRNLYENVWKTRLRYARRMKRFCATFKRIAESPISELTNRQCLIMAFVLAAERRARQDLSEAPECHVRWWKRSHLPSDVEDSWRFTKCTRTTARMSSCCRLSGRRLQKKGGCSNAQKFFRRKGSCRNYL